MSQVKDVVDFVCGDLKMYDPETKEKVMPAIQRAWYKLIGRYAWQFCRRSVTLAYSSTDTNGVLLPGNMVNLIGPIQDSSDVMYVENSPHILPSNIDQYFYYLNDVEVLSLVEGGTACTIKEGATTFTWTGTWLAAYVGEYVRFGDEPGAYLVSASKTISENYWGPRISSGALMIRPKDTRRISFVDGNGDSVTFAGNAHYWAFPAPLYKEWQTFPEHLFEPLKWAAAMEVKGHTVDSKRGLAVQDYKPAFDAALNMAIIQDPSPKPRVIHRDNRGKRMSLGRRG